MTLIKKLWIGMFVLIILSPLGLVLPDHFKAGSAWGEWAGDKMQKLVGYVPQGLKKFSSFWNAPMPDYAFKGWGNKGRIHLSFAYIISALVGMGIITGIAFWIGRIMAKDNE